MIVPTKGIITIKKKNNSSEFLIELVGTLLKLI